MHASSSAGEPTAQRDLEAGRDYPRTYRDFVKMFPDRSGADGGKTWLHDEYRISAGFGFSGSVLLDDGTIVTVTGKSVGRVHGAQVIRWRLPSKEDLLGD